jgi:hypothetical protein
MYTYLFLFPKHEYSMAYRCIPLAPPMIITQLLAIDPT